MTSTASSPRIPLVGRRTREGAARHHPDRLQVGTTPLVEQRTPASPHVDEVGGAAVRGRVGRLRFVVQRDEAALGQGDHAIHPGHQVVVGLRPGLGIGQFTPRDHHTAAGSRPHREVDTMPRGHRLLGIGMVGVVVPPLEPADEVDRTTHRRLERQQFVVATARHRDAHQRSGTLDLDGLGRRCSLHPMVRSSSPRSNRRRAAAPRPDARRPNHEYCSASSVWIRMASAAAASMVNIWWGTWR